MDGVGLRRRPANFYMIGIIMLLIIIPKQPLNYSIFASSSLTSSPLQISSVSLINDSSHKTRLRSAVREVSKNMKRSERRKNRAKPILLQNVDTTTEVPRPSLKTIVESTQKHDAKQDFRKQS